MLRVRLDKINKIIFAKGNALQNGCNLDEGGRYNKLSRYTGQLVRLQKLLPLEVIEFWNRYFL